MNIELLENHLEMVKYIGETLSVEEKIGIRLGLKRVGDIEYYDEIKFWGRIRGTQKNYYILVSTKFLGEYESPSKAFFYSTEDFNFERLPFLIWRLKDFIENVDQKLFTGDPMHTLWQEKKKPEIEDEKKDSEEEEISLVEKKTKLAKKERNKKITELDQLAFTIRAIENECALVPLGAVKINPNHELRYNNNFKGLTLEEGLNIEFWMHYRPPQSEEMKKVIESQDAIFNHKILDGLKNDRPKGLWSFEETLDKNVVLIKNHFWPGFINYHQVNSNQYGYCYFGYGIKNIDLVFMI